MKRCFVFFMIVVLFYSCDSYNRKLKGTDFSVGWINLPELTCIYYDFPSGLSIGVSSQRITDVYWNDKYILAKRCANTSDSLIGYYIITILPENTRPVPWKSSDLMSEEEYEQSKKQLGLNEQEMKHMNIFERNFLW